jgi:hypothetical protein
LDEAFRISKGDDSKIISAFEVNQNPGYSEQALNSIYWYLEDEGLIKPFALRGMFTITFKCIKYFEIKNIRRESNL